MGRSERIEQRRFINLGCTMKNLSSTVKRAVLATATALSILAMPAVAQAATVVGPAATVSPCTNFTFSVTIISCAGGYSNNLLSGTALTDATALAAVSALGGSSGTYLEPTLANLSINNPNSIINFNSPLSGLTIFGMHVGGGGDRNGQGTFFFSFNAAPGTDAINVTGRTGANSIALSNAALFQTGAVPEPATWMFMLIGMAGVGFAMRRKEKQTLRVRYA